MRHVRSEAIDERGDTLDERWRGPFQVIGADASEKNYWLSDAEGRELPTTVNWRFLRSYVAAEAQSQPEVLGAVA